METGIFTGCYDISSDIKYFRLSLRLHQNGRREDTDVINENHEYRMSKEQHQCMATYRQIYWIRSQ